MPPPAAPSIWVPPPVASMRLPLNPPNAPAEVGQSTTSKATTGNVCRKRRIMA